MGDDKKADILRLLTEAQQAADDSPAFRKTLAKLQARILGYLMEPEEVLPPIVIPKPEPVLAPIPEPESPPSPASVPETIPEPAPIPTPIPEPVPQAPIPQPRAPVEALPIPDTAAAAVMLERSAKWEGLLEQTEEAVNMVAERFGWTGEPNPENPQQVLYTYANGLKIIYSKKGFSYYERNVDDTQVNEMLQQKEKELAYAWVELIRPSILVEPVILAGRSKAMLEKLIAEFSARNIHTATKAKTVVPQARPKGFFQNLTDAARRLDQFGRYLDKGR